MMARTLYWQRRMLRRRVLGDVAFKFATMLAARYGKNRCCVVVIACSKEGSTGIEIFAVLYWRKVYSYTAILVDRTCTG